MRADWGMGNRVSGYQYIVLFVICPMTHDPIAVSIVDINKMYISF